VQHVTGSDVVPLKDTFLGGGLFSGRALAAAL
jgi:predicted oxidoreductase